MSELAVGLIAVDVELVATLVAELAVEQVAERLVELVAVREVEVVAGLVVELTAERVVEQVVVTLVELVAAAVVEAGGVGGWSGQRLIGLANEVTPWLCIVVTVWLVVTGKRA